MGMVLIGLISDLVNLAAESEGLVLIKVACVVHSESSTPCSNLLHTQ